MDPKKIKTPIFPAKSNNISLETYLTQNMKIPLKFKGKNYNIYVIYDHKRNNCWNKKNLEIDVKDIPIVITKKNTIYGISIEANYYGISKGRILKDMYIREHYKKYSSNEKKIMAFFEENIKPTLNKNLPKYMLNLLK